MQSEMEVNKLDEKKKKRTNLIKFLIQEINLELRFSEKSFTRTIGNYKSRYMYFSNHVAFDTVGHCLK